MEYPYTEKFTMLLDDEEKLLWCGGVRRFANVIKRLFATLLPMLPLSVFFGFFLMGPTVMIFGDDLLSNPFTWFFSMDNKFFVVYLWVLLGVFCITYILRVADAFNTFFCITDRRIILRSGALRNKFVHYSLKNIGTIEVVSGILDGGGEHAAGTLIISVKDYHLEQATAAVKKLKVSSLEDGYTAYRILFDLTDGANESLRIESVLPRADADR